jgi:hypothetical protein
MNTDEAWLADDELEDDLNDTELEQPLPDEDGFAEWGYLGGCSRRLTALRAIEIAREQLALRRELEDFPNEDRRA